MMPSPMTHPNRPLLQPEQVLLLVVDLQERFAPAIPAWDGVVRRCGQLIEGCALLDIPVVVSEQYPQGLGHTVPAIQQRLPAHAARFEKTTFGCGADPQIQQALAEKNRSQILVCGIETHVCVNQTVHQLLAAGYQVHLVENAVASRHTEDSQIALARMRQSGAIPTSVEMALFELMGVARHPQFKAIQALIK